MDYVSDLVQQHREWAEAVRNLKHNARRYGAARRSEAARRRRRLTARSLRDFQQRLNTYPAAPRRIRGAKAIRSRQRLDLEVTHGVTI